MNWRVGARYGMHAFLPHHMPSHSSFQARSFSSFNPAQAKFAPTNQGLQKSLAEKLITPVNPQRIAQLQKQKEERRKKIQAQLNAGKEAFHNPSHSANSQDQALLEAKQKHELFERQRHERRLFEEKELEEKRLQERLLEERRLEQRRLDARR